MMDTISLPRFFYWKSYPDCRLNIATIREVPIQLDFYDSMEETVERVRDLKNKPRPKHLLDRLF